MVLGIDEITGSLWWLDRFVMIERRVRATIAFLVSSPARLPMT